MGKGWASEAEMLDAITAIKNAAIIVLDDPNPVRSPRGGLDELEEAYEFARGMLTPMQWNNPTFVTLAELADASYPVIHRRTLGLDHAAADVALAIAVERAQNFLARTRPTLS